MVGLIRPLNESDQKQYLSEVSVCSSDQRERVREETNHLSRIAWLGPSAKLKVYGINK